MLSLSAPLSKRVFHLPASLLTPWLGSRAQVLVCVSEPLLAIKGNLRCLLQGGAHAYHQSVAKPNGKRQVLVVCPHHSPDGFALELSWGLHSVHDQMLMGVVLVCGFLPRQQTVQWECRHAHAAASPDVLIARTCLSIRFFVQLLHIGTVLHARHVLRDRQCPCQIAEDVQQGVPGTK